MNSSRSEYLDHYDEYGNHLPPEIVDPNIHSLINCAVSEYAQVALGRYMTFNLGCVKLPDKKMIRLTLKIEDAL